MNIHGHGRWITDTNVELARLRWDQGVVVSAIASEIGDGATKSAIAGYAHRHDWPPRPSPLGRAPAEGRVAKPRVHRPQPLPEPPAPQQRQPQRAPPPKPVAALPAPLFRRCQFIEGDDKRTWQMCGERTELGSAYCATHHALAHVRHRRDAAA